MAEKLVADNWKDFEQRLAAGDDIEELLGLKQPEANEESSIEDNEDLSVTIGGEKFEMKFLVPSFDDITSLGKDNPSENKFNFFVPVPDFPELGLTIEGNESNNKPSTSTTEELKSESAPEQMDIENKSNYNNESSMEL